MVNQKGNFILIALGLMLLLVIALPVLMYLYEPLGLIVKIFLIFVIFRTVQGYLGNGTITLIISGVLIYFLVFKWWWIGASGWLAITLFGLGVFSIITWGSKTIIDLTKPKK